MTQASFNPTQLVGVTNAWTSDRFGAATKTRSILSFRNDLVIEVFVSLFTST